MVQIRKEVWTAPGVDKTVVRFWAGEDTDPPNRLPLADALNMTNAEYAALSEADIDTQCETRYTNWKTKHDAAKNYVMTRDDWKTQEANAEKQRAAAVQQKEFAASQYTKTKAEWLVEEALQESIRAEAETLKTTATTEAAKL